MSDYRKNLDYVRDLFMQALSPWAVPVGVRWMNEPEGEVTVDFILWQEPFEIDLVLSRGGWTIDETGHFLRGSVEVWQLLTMITGEKLEMERMGRARDVRELNGRLQERTQGFLRRAGLDRKGGA